jgi:hypothetical protein
MPKIVLIQCASKKYHRKARAEDLYVSDLFCSGLRYARSLNPDKIFILSAKHGVLPLDKEVEPYNITLNNMNIAAVREWAHAVAKELSEYADLQNDHFIVLAGMRYRKFLLQYLSSYEIPMAYLPIGKQLQFLKKGFKA